MMQPYTVTLLNCCNMQSHTMTQLEPVQKWAHKTKTFPIGLLNSHRWLHCNCVYFLYRPTVATRMSTVYAYI